VVGAVRWHSGDGLGELHKAGTFEASSNLDGGYEVMLGLRRGWYLHFSHVYGLEVRGWGKGPVWIDRGAWWWDPGWSVQPSRK
jgi:hypothetical protein